MDFERICEGDFGRKVCVIGAGTMGGGIALHLANLGFEVTLLDLTPQSVREGFDRAKSASPPHLYLPQNESRVRLGSIEADLEWLAEVGWVCEAVVEKLDIKRDLFERIEPLIAPDAYVTTNTSGLEISLLAEGRSEAFRSKFMGTHFFNPPRYLKLLELIPTKETDPRAITAMTRFLEERVARRVVPAKDTPGFIANRFGMWCMYKAVHVAERLGLSVEAVDAITGPFLGRPRSGSFRLNDIVGLDIMQDIAGNLIARCPDDPFLDVLQAPESLSYLISKGWIGGKVGQGFYRREGKEFLSFDLGTKAYRQRQESELSSLGDLGKLPLTERLREAIELRDEVGEFLRLYLIPALEYAQYLKAEISHDHLSFDRVMQWGFAWELGPFGMLDCLKPGATGVNEGPFFQEGRQLDFAGKYVSIPEEPEYKSLQSFSVLEDAGLYRLRDLGEGVTAISLATKMGTIGPDLVNALGELMTSGKVERYVLTSEAKCFSAGFDLNFFREKIEQEDWEGIDRALTELQQLSLLLGQTPGCAAVFRYCFGAGLELALGCPVAAVDAECQVGFPEARVGLLPGGGGTARRAMRPRRFTGHRRIA
ncbi:MAG: 3-hydroxyacyl-CoA dehydrogenase, partial [Armatimonadetes bacterium OLB18]